MTVAFIGESGQYQEENKQKKDGGTHKSSETNAGHPVVKYNRAVPGGSQ
jgi:hypothetical protein